MPYTVQNKRQMIVLYSRCYKGKKSQIPSFVVKPYITDTWDAILVDVGHEKYSVQTHGIPFLLYPHSFPKQ